MNYITRHKTGVLITGDTIVIKPMGIHQFINTLCLEHITTLQGRLDAAKTILQSSTLVPILIHSDVLLIPTKSPREMDVVYINLHHVLNVVPMGSQIVIEFQNMHHIKLDISLRKFQNLLKRAQKIQQVYDCANQKESVYTPLLSLDFL